MVNLVDLDKRATISKVLPNIDKTPQIGMIARIFDANLVLKKVIVEALKFSMEGLERKNMETMWIYSLKHEYIL